MNTPADEITPFFHQPTQTLFFSSDGWGGKGGFDIFSIKKSRNQEWQPPQNISLNTQQDEFYYSCQTTSKFAYYVSGKIRGHKMAGGIVETPLHAECHIRVFDKYRKTILYGASIEVENIESGVKDIHKISEDDYMKKNKPIIWPTLPDNHIRRWVSK